MKVAVVGGGPVGLYAACAAALAGLDVTVVEKRSGVPDKACGEGLMPAALAALQGIQVTPTGRDFRGIRYLDSTGERQARAALTSPGRGVRRTTLVAALQERAENVGVRRVTARVVSHQQHGHGVQLSCADGSSVTADVVLGCDGLASDIRSQAGLDVPVTGPGRFGLRQHFATPPWCDDVEVYWARQGEAYVTPVAPDLVGVALLGVRGDTFGSRLARFPALSTRLGSAPTVGPVLGAGPLRRSARHQQHQRVLLVGDSAGYVDALTGEGLAVGFVSAKAAVAAVTSDDLASYEGEWRRATRHFRWSTDLLLRTTSRPGPRAALLPLAETAPSVFQRAVALMT
jgi:flavin-dependent dehydrogenase